MTTTKNYPNPFILERADPYVTKGPDGYYYFTGHHHPRIQGLYPDPHLP